MKSALFLYIMVLALPFGLQAQINEHRDSAGFKKYFATGISILEKKWLYNEYVKAIDILKISTKNGALELPRKRSVTAAIFNKLTNYNDYLFLDTNYYDLNSRVNFAATVQQSLSELLLLYYQTNKQVNGKLYYSAEIISLFQTLIYLTEKLSGYANSYLRKNQNLSIEQKEGLKTLTNGLNTFISGVLITIDTDYKSYENEDICSLGGSFFPFYKRIRLSIPADARAEFDSKVRALSRGHELGCIKKLAAAAF